MKKYCCQGVIIAAVLLCLMRTGLAAQSNPGPAGWVPPAGCPTLGPSGPAYVLPTQVDAVAMLPPPPAADSAQQRSDIEAVLQAQRNAKLVGTTARAVADAEGTCTRFSDVLGEELKSPAAEAALRFLSGAAGNAAAVANAPKTYWKRPRPYMASSAVERMADVMPGALPVDPKCLPPEPPPRDEAEAARRQAEKDRLQRERDYTSYPSGHATFGTICAILLADVVPEKRAELFARARQYGESRMIVGAHFPSDVEAGRVAGTVGAALLMQNPVFQRQWAERRLELRAALKLPAKPPALEPEPDFFKRPANSDGAQRGQDRRSGGADPSP